MSCRHYDVLHPPHPPCAQRDRHVAPKCLGCLSARSSTLLVFLPRPVVVSRNKRSQMKICCRSSLIAAMTVLAWSTVAGSALLATACSTTSADNDGAAAETAINGAPKTAQSRTALPRNSAVTIPAGTTLTLSL